MEVHVSTRLPHARWPRTVDTLARFHRLALRAALAADEMDHDETMFSSPPQPHVSPHTLQQDTIARRRLFRDIFGAIEQMSHGVEESIRGFTQHSADTSDVDIVVTESVTLNVFILFLCLKDLEGRPDWCSHSAVEAMCTSLRSFDQAVSRLSLRLTGAHGDAMSKPYSQGVSATSSDVVLDALSEINRLAAAVDDPNEISDRFFQLPSDAYSGGGGEAVVAVEGCPVGADASLSEQLLLCEQILRSLMRTAHDGLTRADGLAVFSWTRAAEWAQRVLCLPNQQTAGLIVWHTSIAVLFAGVYVGLEVGADGSNSVKAICCGCIMASAPCLIWLALRMRSFCGLTVVPRYVLNTVAICVSILLPLVAAFLGGSGSLHSKYWSLIVAYLGCTWHILDSAWTFCLTAWLFACFNTLSLLAGNQSEVVEVALLGVWSGIAAAMFATFRPVSTLQPPDDRCVLRPNELNACQQAVAWLRSIETRRLPAPFTGDSGAQSSIYLDQRIGARPSSSPATPLSSRPDNSLGGNPLLPPATVAVSSTSTLGEREKPTLTERPQTPASSLTEILCEVCCQLRVALHMHCDGGAHRVPSFRAHGSPAKVRRLLEDVCKFLMPPLTTNADSNVAIHTHLGEHSLSLNVVPPSLHGRGLISADVRASLRSAAEGSGLFVSSLQESTVVLEVTQCHVASANTSTVFPQPIPPQHHQERDVSANGVFDVTANTFAFLLTPPYRSMIPAAAFGDETVLVVHDSAAVQWTLCQFLWTVGISACAMNESKFLTSGNVDSVGTFAGVVLPMSMFAADGVADQLDLLSIFPFALVAALLDDETHASSTVTTNPSSRTEMCGPPPLPPPPANDVAAALSDRLDMVLPGLPLGERHARSYVNFVAEVRLRGSTRYQYHHPTDFRNPIPLRQLGHGSAGVVHKVRFEDGSMAAMKVMRLKSFSRFNVSATDVFYEEMAKQRLQHLNIVNVIFVQAFRCGVVVATSAQSDPLLSSEPVPDEAKAQSNDKVGVYNALYLTTPGGSDLPVSPFPSTAVPGLPSASEIVVFSELCSEVNLRVLLLRGPLRSRDAARVSLDVLCGLEHLHRNGSFAGDLKSENVLFGAMRHAKIADYASKFTTLYWRAPEFSRRSPSSALEREMADVWGLGCLQLEMLFGRDYIPFVETLPYLEQLLPAAGSADQTADEESENPATSLTASLQPARSVEALIGLPSSMNAAWRDFLLLCLQPDASKRATIAVLMEHEFVTLTFGTMGTRCGDAVSSRLSGHSNGSSRAQNWSRTPAGRNGPGHQLSHLRRSAPPGSESSTATGSSVNWPRHDEEE